MGFSSKLTEEEEFLKKKYVILRKKKKHLQQLRMKRKQEEAAAAESGPTKAKQKKGLIKSTSDGLKFATPEVLGTNASMKNIQSFNAAANTEAAKKLIKSGAIQVMVKNRTTFKRSLKLTKKKKDDVSSGGKPVFQPFSPSGGSSSDQCEGQDIDKTLKGSPEKPLFKSFSSAQRKDAPNRGRRDRKFERNTPKQGNTVYVHGYNLSKKLLHENFEKLGHIVSINVEHNSKSAFVTFNTMEAAAEAINKMDNAMVSGTRIKVSMARRQPLIESAISSSPWSTLATSQGDKGSNHKDPRAIVVYNDDLFTDDK